MAQAKRKQSKPAKAKNTSASTFSMGGSHGLGMLLTGIVIGSIATALYMGYRSDQQPVFGGGIKQLIDNSRREAQQTAPPQSQTPQNNEQAKATSLDFYTVLPEIERVLPDEPSEPVAQTKPIAKNTATPVKAEKVEVAQPPAPKESEPVAGLEQSFYMLQAGSYVKRVDAESLKAKLALSGIQSSIQAVTIQGRGDFFRVRLGPYANTATLQTADSRLAGMGIKALRLKVSKPAG